MRSKYPLVRGEDRSGDDEEINDNAHPFGVVDKDDAQQVEEDSIARANCGSVR